MVFKNIKKSEKLYVRIAEEINQLIERGDLQVNDKLPPEREIAAQMGVSRPSVREALAILEVLGVVEIKVGDGSYVKGRAHNFRLEMESLKNSSPFELVEARHYIESLVVTLAVERATEDDLTEMQETIDWMREHMADLDVDEFVLKGLHFHRLLARSINNEVLQSIAESLFQMDHHPLWGFLNKKALVSMEAKQHQIKEHEEILAAIRNKDQIQASKAMQHHISHLQDLFLT
ncbi:FadR/GntR family transcriptional regulator [Ammoniphilus resinae]|uniref:DNA-binding FadR family transcriptional regulator n=1 Tax=Ammoniphilus resinae TaxID=861532 RepID=A0ABS4GPK5_9BACL|nr:FadR/GntR family transcriptional regulator [Ammoniphilus resinae]MBP1932199.1 DNA-binding FadR family transcriptional regulator [Ammoniphilus resinae]